MTTVLIVDDDQKLLKMLQRTFVYKGFNAITAGSGTEALAQASAHKPEIIILDWMILKLDGLAVIQRLRGREVVRVLDTRGNLLASPFGMPEDALPLSSAGLAALRQQQEWREIVPSENGRLLIYNRPMTCEGRLISIVVVARLLAEGDRSLSILGTTLIAFGIGWALSGVTLRSIHRIAQTAQAIGNESDFSRRVDYRGPNDEIGQLATAFNSMLARLEQAYQRVNEALNLQRDFVAEVSHELRTPLTTIRGNLELLRRNPPPPAEEQTDILGDLVEESDRLIRLVNELILARADAGRSLLQVPLPLRPVVDEACRQAHQLDPQREISAIAPEALVMGDRDALKQILLILLDNAIKYSRGAILMSAAVEEREALIRVQDSGPGIPPDVLEHLFDRFYRGETDPSIPGFGLGLPIAKALIEAQGRTIAVESQPDQGSTVMLRLPIALPR